MILLGTYNLKIPELTLHCDFWPTSGIRKMCDYDTVEITVDFSATFLPTLYSPQAREVQCKVQFFKCHVCFTAI
jgi:hypothetical protein